MWLHVYLVLSPSRALRDAEAEEIFTFDGRNVELHQEEEIDPWDIGDAHGLVHTVVQGTKPGDLSTVISHLMSVCESEVPHMCLGRHKSAVLQDTVFDRLQDGDKRANLHVLELGAHSGDGTLHLFNHLPRGSAVVSVDADPQDVSEGAKLVRHAIHGLGMTYHPMVVDHDAAFDEFLDNLSENYGIPAFDVVMFDQEPHHFHPHLETLLKKKMLRPNARVIADNIKRHGSTVNSFVEAVSTGPFKTTLHDIPYPYSDTISVSKYIPVQDEL